MSDNPVLEVVGAPGGTTKTEAEMEEVGVIVHVSSSSAAPDLEVATRIEAYSAVAGVEGSK